MQKLNDQDQLQAAGDTEADADNRTQSRHVGKPVPRREDARLTTGRGSYVDDVALHNAAQVMFLRSPYSSGQLVEVDISDALEMPGVIAVFTGDDLAGLGSLSVNAPVDVLLKPGYPILAQDRISSVGQPVAAVVAETNHAALDAIETIGLDVSPDTPADTPVALAGRWAAGKVEQIFSEAAHRVAATIRHPRLAPSPMEPRAIAADYDVATDGLTVWLSTQTPHRARTEMATILKIAPERIRVIAPDVGGAFGMKASLYPEDVLIAWAALTLKRPVRWTATRSEDLLSATHGRGALCRGELALDRDGRFLALKADILCPLGHWLPTSAAVPAWNAGRILPGPYDIEAIEISTRGELSKTAPVGIYRGAGRPEACALMERLADEAARATGMDPVEIRQRNLVPHKALPHARPTGAVLDSGDYQVALDTLCQRANYPDLLNHRDVRRQAGEVTGIGIALYVEPCGQGWESASVTINPDGTVEAATGTSSQGHGRETAYAQIVADELGIPMERVAIVQGDTASCPPGIGALASRSTPIGGSALKQAAAELRQRLGTAEPGNALSARVVYEADGEAWSYGGCLAVVSVDGETGVLAVEKIVFLDDAGPAINPIMVDGQILGGIAQGLGEALLERIVYDDDGQLLTGSFTDYALPRADDMPGRIDIAKMHTPSPFNLIGSKGVGEAGTIGTPAAILNAALDALRPLGVSHIDPPLTSEKIWRAIQTAKQEPMQ